MTAESVQHSSGRVLGFPLVAGAFLALLAVMAGAFGAHGLRNLVSERGLEVFQTAVTYQIYHSIALVLLALLAGQGLPRKLLGWSAGFFLVLTDIRWIGPITPIGGVCFMVGWALLITSGLRRNK